VVLFESSSNAFVATLSNFGKLSPTKIGRSSGLIDFLSNCLSVTKVAQNTEQMRQLKQRLPNGENVPEIDAWLANNPFQGARSVRELREMYPGAEEPMLERLFAVYQTQNSSSNFNSALDGAKDIWTSQFPNLLEGPKNLIGWAIDKVWNGAGKVIITTYDYAKLVLERKEQIAWLWDKAKSQLILTKVKNNEPVTLPQSTFDIVISNGKAHKPTVVADYQVSLGTQTLTVTPEPISITPIGFNAYVGQFFATFDETNNLGTCRFTVNLSIKVEVPTDGRQTGNMIVNGTWNAQVIALAPGVTNIEPSSGTYTFQNVKGDVEIVYDPNSRPIVVQGSLMNTWSNAAAGVGIVGEISGSRINADVVFVPRFGPFMPTHTKSVTLNRQ